MPKISIIIPVYKVEQYIEMCLDSILAQTFKDWEVICVNDGSPDKCGDILNKYAQKDKRIKVITQENLGVSMARNNALREAKGKYICFLDSDDELAPDFLEKMYQTITTENADVVWCDWQQGIKKNAWTNQTASGIIYDDVFARFLLKAQTWAPVYGINYIDGKFYKALNLYQML